jgi:hypothetical protein
MAIGLLAVLTSVPWSEVINNAPKVADGAKKLWNTVSKKSSNTNILVKSHTIDTLETRVTALEEMISDLHAQMLASSELIKELADQNAQLIRRIEKNRLHIVWLIAATAIIAIVALALGLILISSNI